MRGWRRLLFTCVAAASIAAAGCGDPPDREIQQAQGAIDAARAAGAAEYAADEFAGAETALKSAQTAVAQRDYRLALNLALDSRERAQNAAKEAADHKAAARSAADRALAAATAALDMARARLRTAEAAHVSPRSLAAPRRTIADAGSAVQKARTAVERGTYLGIPEKVGPLTARLNEAARELEAVTAPASRRRR
jgi:hypothetical protein